MGSCMGHGRKNQGREMTDRTHPDSGRIITSGDVINDLHDEIAQLRGTCKVLWNLLGECLPVSNTKGGSAALVILRPRRRHTRRT